MRGKKTAMLEEEMEAKLSQLKIEKIDRDQFNLAIFQPNIDYIITQ